MISNALIHMITEAIELMGVGIIVVGALFSLACYLRAQLKKSPGAYEDLRRGLGRSILLGLEFLVAGDIVNTVAVEPSIESVYILGLIVIIRTFLSFSIEVELEKRLPWRKD
ncbi:MAG TPA: DUF1622 domain-containing protein [Bacteriovoracaceae bacterium]|nr:DUF1622 domain-containing protein [Bacteriovoracaceae bacterium]